MNALDLSGGFVDRPREAAAAFRAVLAALSEPGTVQEVSGVTPPDGLTPAAAGLLLTLADATTPLWLPEELVGSPVAGWLTFHTNAPQTADRGKAAFAVGRWDALLPLSSWAQGTSEFPDRSATLIVEVDSLTDGPVLNLSGPGIDGTRDWCPTLPAQAAQALRQNAAQAPLGVDLFFTAGRRVCGLPRSTRVEG